jgi:type I restriction enzyme M protein
LHDIYRDYEPYDPLDAVVEITKILFLKLADEKSGEERLTMRYIREESSRHPGKTERDIFDDLLKDRASEYHLTELKFNVKNVKTLIEMTRALEGLRIRDELDVLGEAYEGMLKDLFRGQLGQFFTPRTIVEFMVELTNPVADIEVGLFDRIIDPFAGSCGFLIYHLKRLKGNALKKASGVVLGIEKSPRIGFVGAINLFLHGGNPNNVIVNDSFRYDKKGRIGGVAEPCNWDVVITNPPFGSRVRSDDILKDFEARGWDCSESEALALRVMLDLAKEGGKIVTVVPESLVKDPKFSKLRRLIRKEAIVKAYISLPLSAFYAYGSTIKTGVLYLVKRGSNVKEQKVFFDCARYVGIDRTGRRIEKNDLPVILERFKSLERGVFS